MSRTIPLGVQSFSEIRQDNLFYVDTTKFIKDWWNSFDQVTLITRPRRFGKTLLLDTVKTFFSPEFSGCLNLFEGLDVWRDEQFRRLQGTIPVIYLSFADVKGETYEETVELINASLIQLYHIFLPILDIDILCTTEKEQINSVRVGMSKATAHDSLLCLCEYLVRQKFNTPIILLDEYDTPLGGLATRFFG